jgi:hypothetical protein
MEPGAVDDVLVIQQVVVEIAHGTKIEEFAGFATANRLEPT